MLTSTLCVSVDETVAFFSPDIDSYQPAEEQNMSVIDLVDFTDQLCYKCLSFWLGNEQAINTNTLSC